MIIKQIHIYAAADLSYPCCVFGWSGTASCESAHTANGWSQTHTKQNAQQRNTQHTTHNAAHKMYIFIVEDTQSTTVESQGTHGAAHGWGREGQYLRCALPSVPTNTTPTTTPTSAPTTAGSTLTSTTTAAGGCRLQ